MASFTLISTSQPPEGRWLVVSPGDGAQGTQAPSVMFNTLSPSLATFHASTTTV